MARQNLFWVQLRALIWKNWIVLSKHSFLTLLRCFILPIAYGAFLATAQVFLNRLNTYGLGTAVPIKSLENQFDGKTSLIWADDTDGTSNPSPAAIIARITANFTPYQQRAVKKLPTASDFPAECPQNFNFFSQCFAAIAFNDIPGNGTNPVNYTITSDSGLTFIDVVHHTSDFEKRILPLQWSIDKAIIELQTGVAQVTPLQWPYNTETNEQQKTGIRLSYIRGIRELLGLAFFISFIGIAYQLPGSIAGERALLLTEHMKVMGLLDSARIISWHLGVSITYLPAWVIVGLTWKFRLFVHTSAGLIVILHILLGLVLASWSFFIAAPFGKSPQLAAVVTTFLAIIFAILALVIKSNRTGSLVVFSLIFPPMFYIFSLKAICGYENHQIATNALHGDPDHGYVLLPLLIVGLIDVFLWPYLAVVLERYLYDAQPPSGLSKSTNLLFWRKAQETAVGFIPENTAISIRGLTKTYKASKVSSKDDVTAVKDLDLDIPKSGIFVMLGSNGAGKSTTLSVISGLASRTSGTVTFEGGTARPSRGTLGIVPQKNVLFPELTCIQTLRVWRAIKWSDNSVIEEDLEQLLRDCDLDKKITANANTLSGGQKRKLQLAIGLLGGSKIVLIDECTSGVDPLSRRAIWKTLTSFREDRTIVFTTHFLDEADLLADHIAILAAPGKVVASGSPVALKQDLGDGYSINVTFLSSIGGEKSDTIAVREEILREVRGIAPAAYISTHSPHQMIYHLKTREGAVVSKILQIIDSRVDSGHVESYEIIGTTIEDIFLDLMSKVDIKIDNDEKSSSRDTATHSPIPKSMLMAIDLPTGKAVSPFRQAFTIFHKRLLIAKRSWLTPFLTIAIAVAGACIPLVFINGKNQSSCTRRFGNSTFDIPLYLPVSPIVPFTFGPSSRVLVSPPGTVSTLGKSTNLFRVTNVPNNATFVDDITHNFRNLSLGGISLDLDTGASLFAWEATPPGITGPSMLNLASNILYNRALNSSSNSGRIPTIIRASYSTFPPVAAGTLVSLKWIVFFGAVMAVYPAFFALYVSKERRSSVQAMQLSNGLTNPIGLWLGHLMYDTLAVVTLSTIIIIVFAAASDQFHGLGFFWFVLVQYGVVGALFAYCVSLVVSSPLAAFATVAGYQFVIFILYLSAYLLILTYGKVTESAHLITVVHFSMSIAAPVASITRAALVSVNLFSLLCNGSTRVNSSSLGSIIRFGGPILYLFIYGFILLGLLVWADSGTNIPRRLRARKASSLPGAAAVSNEAIDVVAGSVSEPGDLLRVIQVSKAFNNNQVVDDVSFGVGKDTVFALLGPNGAGKTTTFNMIRGDIVPDVGDIFINGTSVIRQPRIARTSLGVCPQFTAIDSQLTVREHLFVYGRLKGLDKGPELLRSIEAVMQGTSLGIYADRLASKLSGGNQRKLSLAIALIGNPSVILIDEFSTGIDPKMKRDMWQTLRTVSIGKAVIITTHSMEEASALANSVGILAKRMLALGTTESLSRQYAVYEVHFNCRTREEVVKARNLMTLIPGSRIADDVATRFEVPITSDSGTTLAELFNTLSNNGDFTEYTVERASLESVFLKVIRENNIREADNEQRNRRRAWWRC